jgi:phytoene desaturase
MHKMQREKVVVIGSGIAGMAASIRLASHGFKVEVYETNDYPGGKLSFFENAGYKFDAGPSLFTQPQNIEELFIVAQEPITHYLNYVSVDVSCNYFFENGKRLTAYTNKEKLYEEFREQLEESPESIKRYLKDAEKLYDNVGNIFLNYSLHKSKTWLHQRVLKALSAVKTSYLFGTLNQHNNSVFKSEEAIQIFNRFATYNGSNPFKAPGMLSLIPHLEQNQGTYYPKGGMISITNALYQLALKKGVSFHFNHKVEKIEHQHKKITGIITNNRHVDADIVVSNGDVYYTYKNLLNHQSKSEQLLKLERSSSALIFYWGIKKEFSQLGLHNILFSEDYKKEFEDLFDTMTMTDDPTIYINITAKMEKNQAPEGCENWFVMINAPANVGQDWEKIKLEIRSAVINKINRILNTDIEKHIETEDIMDPVSIEQKTGTFKGSLYGTSSNSKFAAFFRPANFTSKFKGLYFCGGTVHPGGGIPLCLKSAYIMSEIIKTDYEK